VNEQSNIPGIVETGHVFQSRAYLAQTLDPVHVGTGEFQLGRVDNLIVREAGTNLPKIPGSSLAGVTRAFMAMSTQGKSACAGKGSDSDDQNESSTGDHCAQFNCPVCMSFGYSKKRKSFQGLVQFTDARVLFFPVFTLRGPMWITSPGTMEAAGLYFSRGKGDALDSKLREEHAILYWPSEKEILSVGAALNRLNLGWLYLSRYHENTVPNPAEWEYAGDKCSIATAAGMLLKPILSRIVIVDDEIFPIIVEDQLEVRTTVSINPKTGAAADGALFTSEAIPRSTFLQFQITTLSPDFFINPTDNKAPGFTQDDLHLRTGRALEYVEHLGLGAATTRGMGRVRIRPLSTADPQGGCL
jgi:CRISPR-associated protein Cmr4